MGRTDWQKGREWRKLFLVKDHNSDVKDKNYKLAENYFHEGKLLSKYNSPLNPHKEQLKNNNYYNYPTHRVNMRL